MLSSSENDAYTLASAQAPPEEEFILVERTDGTEAFVTIAAGTAYTANGAPFCEAADVVKWRREVLAA